MRKTIRVAQFMYYQPTGEQRFNRKTGQDEEVLSVRHAFFGDVVDVPRAEDIESGENAGAFEQDEVEQESPVAEEPAATDGPVFDSHDSLVLWIKNTKPSAAAVVAAADNDPDKADQLLAAENEATGGQPRKAVKRDLEAIMEEEEDE